MLYLGLCKIERVSRLVDTNLIVDLPSPKQWISDFDPIPDLDEHLFNDAVDSRPDFRGLVSGNRARSEYRHDEFHLADGRATDADRLGHRFGWASRLRFAASHCHDEEGDRKRELPCQGFAGALSQITYL
jgi:hypothetical protein